MPANRGIDVEHTQAIADQIFPEQGPLPIDSQMAVIQTDPTIGSLYNRYQRGEVVVLYIFQEQAAAGKAKRTPAVVKTKKGFCILGGVEHKTPGPAKGDCPGQGGRHIGRSLSSLLPGQIQGQVQVVGEIKFGHPGRKIILSIVQATLGLEKDQGCFVDKSLQTLAILSHPGRPDKRGCGHPPG
jgi:hypothetical protein